MKSARNDGNLAFVIAPDYEDQINYNETITVSDGINTATQDITINVTVDNYPYEASWNVYDYQQNSYIYTENFTFSENYESQTLELNLLSLKTLFKPIM